MANRTSRLVRLWVLLAVAAVAVAACSGGGESAAPGGESAAPGASAPPAGESAAPGGSPAAGGEFNCENIGGEVSVVGSWTGSEEDSFRAMIAPWEECSGATVNYTGSRDLAAQLTTGIASGTLPDVAGLPGPGLMKEWYDQGALKPLSFVDFATYEANTPPGFAAAGKGSDDQLLGIFTKAAVKGLIYFNTANWQGGEPATWEELNTAARGAVSGDEKQWCIGVESGAASGWPGTDWIEDILLQQQGKAVYQAWATGGLAWTDPRIGRAWRTWGSLFGKGAARTALLTDFRDAGRKLFAARPTCALEHQGSFIRGGYAPKDRAHASFAFSTGLIPGADRTSTAREVSADFAAMFHETPQSRRLLAYLTSAKAQTAWAENTASGRTRPFFANGDVPLSVQPDDVGEKIAKTLKNSRSLCLDASDAMPTRMRLAFQRAALAYLSDVAKGPDALLTSLEKVRTDLHKERGRPWLSTVCG